MRKRLAALAAIMALTLSACGEVGAGGVQFTGEDVDLPDGRTVVCVIASGGGVDCDWKNAR